MKWLDEKEETSGTKETYYGHQGGIIKVTLSLSNWYCSAPERTWTCNLQFRSLQGWKTHDNWG